MIFTYVLYFMQYIGPLFYIFIMYVASCLETYLPISTDDLSKMKKRQVENQKQKNINSQEEIEKIIEALNDIDTDNGDLFIKQNPCFIRGRKQ